MTNEVKECLSCRSPYIISNGLWVRREILHTACQEPDAPMVSWFEPGGEPQQPLG